LLQHRAALVGDRNQTINLFRAFELVLGPVGAAKALHLLAPRLFPTAVVS